MLDCEGIKKHKDVFDAWLDGAEIQYQCEGGDNWRPTLRPTWSQDLKYRVKPAAPETRVGWVNVYRYSAYLYITKADADIVMDDARIACVPVMLDFIPGDGLIS